MSTKRINARLDNGFGFERHYEAIEDSMTIEIFGPGRTFGAPPGMGG